jgi:Domain of unknown function (DUF1841)
VLGGLSGECAEANGMRYNPDKPVDAAEWLELDEAEQQLAVERYHKRTRVRLPSPRVHAIIHAAIETQVAQGHAAAKRALERMQAEGLDRHDAIHALGSVMTKHMFGIMKEGQAFDESAYGADLDDLSAERWLAEWREG